MILIDINFDINFFPAVLAFFIAIVLLLLLSGSAGVIKPLSYLRFQKQPPQMPYKKTVLKNFAIFTVKTLVLDSLFHKKRDSNIRVFL